MTVRIPLTAFLVIVGMGLFLSLFCNSGFSKCWPNQQRSLMFSLFYRYCDLFGWRESYNGFTGQQKRYRRNLNSKPSSVTVSFVITMLYISMCLNLPLTNKKGHFCISIGSALRRCSTELILFPFVYFCELLIH